jgi:branched-chain amino acid transport system substrate-binding protein
MKERRLSTGLLAIVGLAGTLAFSCSAWAQKAYGTGASDNEIRFGQTMSYSGPNSAFSVLGKVADGYFRKVNDEGGINGRKLHFISYDDAYNPAKTVEQTRRLVKK